MEYYPLSTFQFTMAVAGAGVVGGDPGPLDIEARGAAVLDRLLDGEPAAHVRRVQGLGPRDR